MKAEPASVAPLALPGVDRLVLVASSIGLTVAAVSMISSWPAYRAPAVEVGLWVALASVIPLAQWRVRRRGRLTGRAVAVILVVLVVIDLGVPLLAPARQWYQAAGWNWGSVALVVFALAAYRPVREVYLVALGHTAIGLCLAPFMPVHDPVEIIQFATGTLIPAMAAAHYFSLYLSGLRAREAAMERRRRSLRVAAADEGARLLLRERLGSIRPKIITLLSTVASGNASPRDDGVRGPARRLAVSLRRELDESLAAARSYLPLASAGSLSGTAQIDVLGSPELLLDQDRVTLGAIVNLLVDQGTWGTIGVTVAAWADSDDVLAVTLVATGAEDGTPSPALGRLLNDLGASVWSEAGSLVIEARRPRAMSAGRDAAGGRIGS